MENSNLKPAIIVFRHGQDLPKGITWPQKSNLIGIQNTYTLPSGKKVTPPHHGLSKEGFYVGYLLGVILPQWIEEHNYYPVNRVITKNPEGFNSEGGLVSPNPFETVFPFIHFNQIKDVIFPKKDAIGLEQLVQNKSLLKDQTSSTLICWDAEGLWGPKVGEGEDRHRVEVPEENSLLRSLAKKNYKELTSPKKGSTIYAFTDEGNGEYKLKQRYFHLYAEINKIRPT